MIELTKVENGVVIRPTGMDIVASSVPELRSTMKAAVDEGAREIVVDLSTVNMLDSTGIGLLISAHNSLRRVGGTLSVIDASNEILELLKSMRIHQHFSVSGRAEQS